MNVIEKIRQTTGAIKNIWGGTGDMFTPNKPIDPIARGEQQKQPLRNQFRSGQNIMLQNREEDDNRDNTFQMLRNIARYDVARICIESKKNQVRGLKWDIVNKNSNDKNTYDQEKQAAIDFFKKPDGFNSFSTWLGSVIEDILVIDALTLFKRKTKSGKLHSLIPVDGATIKPLIDIYGLTPTAPNPAYQQIIHGMPYTEWTIDDMLYKPMNMQSNCIYGFSPIEWVFAKVNLQLRRDTYFLDYYRIGGTPDGGMVMVDNLTVSQLEEINDYWNSILSGNNKNRLGLQFMPGGTYVNTKEIKFDNKFDEWLARVVAIAFGVNPQKFCMLMNRATAEVQDQQQTDEGLEPLLEFLKGIFDDVLQNDLGYPDLQFSFISKKAVDEQQEVLKNDTYVKAGIKSIDEVRQEQGLEPIGVGHFITTPLGLVALNADTYKQMQERGLPNSQAEPPYMGSDYVSQANVSRDDSTGVNGGDSAEKKHANQDEDIGNENILTKADDLPVDVKDKKKRMKKYWEKLFDDEREGLITIAKKVGTVQEIAERLKKHKCFYKDWEGHNKAKKVVEQAFVDNIKDEFGVGVKFAYEQMESGLLIFPKNPINELQKQGAKWAKDNAGTRIKGISDTTLDKLKSYISNAIKEEWTLENTIQGLSEGGYYNFSSQRAETIARTEIMNAYNQGCCQAYKDNDITEVYVTDGDVYDEACAAANGAIWTLEEALANPLEHPNCVRQFFPISNKSDKQ